MLQVSYGRLATWVTASAWNGLPGIGRACWLLAFHSVCEAAPTNMALREHGLHLFRSAVGTVLPGPMLKKALVLETGRHPRLVVHGRPFELRKNLYLVGFGKAVLGMAAVVESILGDHIVRGIVSVPQGIQATLKLKGMR